MGVLKITESSIEFSRRNEMACISAWGKDVLRFRSSANGYLNDENWILIEQENCEVATYMEGNHAVIVNGNIKAVMYDNGKVVYYKKDKADGEFKILLEEMTEYAFDSFYRTYRAKGSNTHTANVLFKPYADEHFYGLGGEHNDCFDMKGTVSV